MPRALRALVALLALSELVATLPAARAGQTQPTPRGPNVIVVMTDDQGYGDLSCHGNPVLKTPNLDRLHDQAVRFTDFHVAPMCTPTRGQLLTGRDALDNGAMNVSSGRTLLRRGIPTLADRFAAAGYRTGQFGKWHVGDNAPYRPQDRGFQESVWFPSSHIGSAHDVWNNDYFDDVYEHNGRREPFQGYCTDVFFEAALAWIREQAGRHEPFLAYIPTNAPHGPLFVPDAYRAPYRNRPRPLASFFGMIANIDENMGKLEALLEETGLRDDTILVYLTDNGGTAGVNLDNAGMRGRKIELYEGGHRVPCFVRWPGGKLGDPRDVAGLTQCQDLLPTLLDLAGVPILDTAQLDGTSLAPVLRGQVAAPPDRKLVIQFSRMDQPRPTKGDGAVLWRRWRLIQDRELYDLESDPAQSQNVIADHPDVVRSLRDHYDRWWAEVEPALDRFGAIRIDPDPAATTLLSACDWQDVFLDQMAQVRKGEPKAGTNDVEIVEPGNYEFTLRRWPEESSLPLTAPSPEHRGPDGIYPPGVALPIAGARLRVGPIERSHLLDTPASTGLSFRVALPAGRHTLRAEFHDPAGSFLCGAYFVNVRRSPPSD